MLRSTVVAILLALSVATSSPAHEIVEVSPILYWKVCEGDPSGSKDDGSLKELFRGWMPPAHGYGNPVRHSQDLQDIPGEQTKQPHGIVMEMTVHSVTKTHVRADLRLDVTTPTPAESPDYVATSGTTHCVSGKFPVRKANRIWLTPETEGVPRWLDISFETMDKVSSSEDAEETAAPAKWRAWIPTWRLPGLSSRAR
jgi:hypothetical protein